MNFTQFLLIVRARKRSILTTFFSTVVVIVGISAIMPKLYTATVTLVVDAKGFDPITGISLPYQLTPGYISTQEAIISSQGVAARVVDSLQLQKIPALQSQFESAGGEGGIRNYIAGLLLDRLTVKPELNTNLVDISFESPNPRFSAIVANAFANAYIGTNLDLKTQPAQQAAAWYEQQVVKLRDNLQKAQNALATYQQKNGLVLSDQRLSLETSLLADLSAQLASAEASRIDATSKQRERRHLPNVIDNPVVQVLTPELAQLDARVAKLSRNLGPSNPTYQSELAQRNAVQQQLNDAYQVAEEGIMATAQASQTQVAGLRSAIRTQKKKVLKLKGERDEVSVLEQDVSNAKLAYNAAVQRMDQDYLEAKSVQTDVAILNPATPPMTPSSPKILLNALIAVFVGTLLGIGGAFALELLDRKIRSTDDIEMLLGLPLLNRHSKPQVGLAHSVPKLLTSFMK